MSQPQYPPPQPGYPPQQGYPPPGPPPQQMGYGPPPAQTVVAQPVAVMACGVQVMRECPVRVTCASCRADIVTATTFEVGMMTWLIAGILCVLGCWPCCLIPFCVDGCKDVIHTCPNCKAQVGVYRRM
ncbi:lipopolysaccharide-induced tumor necrosis factor-alpha factor homolog [Saccostrea cucullata]|uniref:lipopolysaccharide-induced tumor necrosis factor-alpha factor homolog n=1 Tax=Saccostrea cuccullata TaxID=36930 RepID=UPI002ED293A5